MCVGMLVCICECRFLFVCVVSVLHALNNQKSVGL